MDILMNTKLKLGIIFTLSILLILFATCLYSLGNYQKELLINSRFEQLISVRQGLKSHLDSYQTNTEKTLHSISLLTDTIKALKQLAPAFNALKNTTKISSLDIQLTEYYQTRFLNNLHFNIPNAEPKKATSAYLPLKVSGKVAQQKYLLNAGKITDPQNYDRLHSQFHPLFEHLLKIYGFYDLFLLDPQGNIIYSVMKETDFATNLLKGPYQKSGLAKVFRESSQTKAGQLSFATFLPYEPSLNIPSAFLAIPVYTEGLLSMANKIEPVSAINIEPLFQRNCYLLSLDFSR